MDRARLGFDHLARFWLDSAPARGVVGRFDQALAEALRHHAYPPAVRSLLRQLGAAALLLASNLKQPATIIVQAQGDGDVPLLCVEATDRLTCRAYADVRLDRPISDDADLCSVVAGDGAGRLVFTIDPARGQMYQGIVALEHRSVANLLEAYLTSSQQTDTRLWLREDGDAVEAVLLERLPIPGANTESERAAWHAIEAAIERALSDVFMPFPYEQWLEMVLPDHAVRLHPAQPVAFACPCSLERVLGALRLVGWDELKPLIDENGCVDTRCEFCGRNYRVDRAQVEELFRAEAADGRHPPGTSTLQ